MIGSFFVFSLKQIFLYPNKIMELYLHDTQGNNVCPNFIFKLLHNFYIDVIWRPHGTFWSIVKYPEKIMSLVIPQWKNHSRVWGQVVSLEISQPSFACSKSIIETPDQYVKFAQS